MRAMRNDVGLAVSTFCYLGGLITLQLIAEIGIAYRRLLSSKLG